MSLILDALRRGRSKPHQGAVSPRTAQTDSVLATLGYSPWHRYSRSSRIKKLVGYWVVSVFFALVVWGAAIWYTQAPLSVTSPRQSQVHLPATGAGSAAPTPAPQAPPGLRPAVAPPGPPGVGVAPTGQPTAAPSTVASVGREPVSPAQPATRAPQAGAVTAPAQPATRTPQATVAAAPTAPATQPPEVPPSASRQARAEPQRPPTTTPKRPDVPETRPLPPPQAPAREALATTAGGAAGSVSSDAEHFRLGVYYHRAGDFEKALKHYRALLERNELNAEVHNNLGLLYQDKGLMEEAVKEFQRAILIDQRYVKAHNNLGVAFLRLGKLDAAEGEFRAALASDPRNVESLVNLALAMKTGGRREEARETLIRALSIDSRNAASHYNLAMLCEEVGDFSLALEHYRAFVQYGSAEYANLIPEVRARITALTVRVAK